MTLDEAIVHAKEVGLAKVMKCDSHQCGLEHLQLAKWLEELKVYRSRYGMLSNEMLSSYISINL